jgi:hypothetical protein
MRHLVSEDVLLTLDLPFVTAERDTPGSRFRPAQLDAREEIFRPLTAPKKYLLQRISSS